MYVHLHYKEFVLIINVCHLLHINNLLYLIIDMMISVRCLLVFFFLLETFWEFFWKFFFFFLKSPVFVH